MTLIPLPGQSAPDADKLVHLVLYAGLGALTVRAAAVRVATNRTALGVLIAVSAFGAANEWNQRFVGRSASHADWVADTIGGAVGILAAKSLARRQREPTW